MITSLTKQQAGCSKSKAGRKWGCIWLLPCWHSPVPGMRALYTLRHAGLGRPALCHGACMSPWNLPAFQPCCSREDPHTAAFMSMFQPACRASSRRARPGKSSGWSLKHKAGRHFKSTVHSEAGIFHILAEQLPSRQPMGSQLLPGCSC